MIKYAERGRNADGESILNAKLKWQNVKLNKKIVPYGTHPTSVFDKGQLFLSDNYSILNEKVSSL